MCVRKRPLLILAAAIGLVFVIPTWVLAAPTLTVTSQALNGSGNRIWLAQVTPDPAELPSALAVELGFTITNATLVDVAGDTNVDAGMSDDDTWYYQTSDGMPYGGLGTNGLWVADPNNPDLQNLGNNPFTGTVTEGLYTDTVAQQVFVALGSEVFTTDSPVNLLQIVTSGDTDATITWADGLISQNGMVTTGVSGSASVTSGLLGDFNGDGNLDCADINPLTTEIAAGTNNVVFDLTGDDLVNLDDRDAWLASAGANNLMSGNPYLLGDASLDGSVDVSDFNIWNGNKFTIVAEWCAGDFNADGSVDVSDFNIWNENKFQMADAHVSSVPEPATCAMLALMGILLVPAWRRLHRISRKDVTMVGRNSLVAVTIVCLIGSGLMLHQAQAAQQVVSIAVDADTYIERDDNDTSDPPNNDTNYGDSVEMLVKAGSDGGLTSDIRKALIRFDITGSTINPDQLYIFEVTTNDDDRANQTHTVNAITDPALQEFEELGITWNNSPASAKVEDDSFNSAGPAVGTFGPVLASPQTPFQTIFFGSDFVSAVFEGGGNSLVTFGIGGSGNSTLGLQTKETTSGDLTGNPTPSPARLLTFDAINSAASGSVMAGSTWTGGAVPAAGNQYIVVDGHNVTADASASNFAGEALIVSNGSVNYTANEVTIPLVVVTAGNTVSESLNGDFLLGDVFAPTLGKMVLNGDLTVNAENGGDFGLDVELSGMGNVTVNSTAGTQFFITSIAGFGGNVQFNGNGEEVLYEGPTGSGVTLEMNSTGTNRLALNASSFGGLSAGVIFNQQGEIDHRADGSTGANNRLMSIGSLTVNADITIDLTKTYDRDGTPNERRLFAANGWRGAGNVVATGTPTDPTTGAATLNELEIGGTSQDGPDATHFETDGYSGTLTLNDFLNMEVRDNIPSAEVVVNQNARLEFGHRDVESLFTTRAGEVTVNSGGSLEVGYEADGTHVPYNLQLTKQWGQSGDLNLNNGATTIMQISGTDPTKFDQIVAEGVVTLDGTLELLISPDVPSQTVICGTDGVDCVYTPTDGDTFDLIVIGAETLAADYDGNGTVGSEDYAIWRETFGEEFDLTADGNQDGIVNIADYTVWRNAFGESGSVTGMIDTNTSFDSVVINDPGGVLSGFSVSVGYASQAVTLTVSSLANIPEPSSLIIMVLGGWAFAMLRRQRRR